MYSLPGYCRAARNSAPAAMAPLLH
jgi:hypothetical protein